MSSSVLDLYDRLRTAPDDETRARIIAEAFETLEERYPHLGDMATRTNLSETELRLIKEIEQVRAELKVELARGHTAWLKWSFLFWLTQFSAILLLLWRVWPGQ